MENNTVQNVVHGYKVFNSDWTCRGKKYTCPGKFEEEGELKVCGHGMHFCQTAADCFNYYSFNSKHKVAEVIAYGEVLTNCDKSCTDKLEIVREIAWDEVLQIVNTGKNCTGLRNSGNYNSGDRNSGNFNSGNCNSGNYNTGNRNSENFNTGYRNSGNSNSGDYNTGDYNTGYRNSGDCNTGDYNTRDYNIGDYNSGNYNTGDYNTGDYNTGNYNTGNYNSGDCNTGDWNKSSFNNGCFNTKKQKIMLFNKPSDWTYDDWLYSEARDLLTKIPRAVIEWVSKEDMTDEEKAEYPTYKTTGGYLKVPDESECRQLWWDRLPKRSKTVIKSIPNFDSKLFKECTGIDVDKTTIAK